MKSSTPDRLACVDLAAFPLQLMLRRHPDWSAHPAAVVAEDRPQGWVLWVNEKARQQGILPGLRYAAAFSLAPALRAAEVPPVEIKKAINELTHRLMRFTPEVEPSADEPGIIAARALLKYGFAYSVMVIGRLGVNVPSAARLPPFNV